MLVGVVERCDYPANTSSMGATEGPKREPGVKAQVTTMTRPSANEQGQTRRLTVMATLIIHLPSVT